MKIIISNSSSVPIYEQIKNTIINQIMNDELKEDEVWRLLDGSDNLDE